MGKNIRIALLGARGMIGKTLLKILAEQSLDFTKDFSLDCFGTSEDTEVSFGEKVLKVQKLTAFKAANFDLIFSAISADMALELADEIMSSGAIWVDKSPALRMNDEVPLVVPEVNGDLTNGKKIIASPNCVVIPVSIFLKTVLNYGLKSVVLSTYQSVSGAGVNAMNGFFREMKATCMKPLYEGLVYKHPMMCNVIPAIGAVDEHNECDEEVKIKEELRKVLALPDLQLSVTSMRVPVLIGHMVSLTFTLEQYVTPERLIKKMTDIGIQYSMDLVTPIMAASEDCVFACRLRYDGQNTYSIVIVCDNLRKGGALNALQIAKKVLNI